MSKFILIVLIFLIISCSKAKNPYEYDLGELKKVSEDLIGYFESESIPIAMENPERIYIDEDKNIYVSGEKGIFFYNLKTKAENTLFKDKKIVNFAVKKNGDFFLFINNHIEIYNNSETLLDQWADLSSNAFITDLELTEKSLFAADAENKVVYIFNLTGKMESIVSIDDLHLPGPYFDIESSEEGFFWISDPGNHGLKKFSIEGELISAFNKSSFSIDGFSGCCNPVHFELLPGDFIFTVEKGLLRAKLYDSKGSLISVVASSEKFKDGTPFLDISVDSDGTVYILDPGNMKIRIFKKKGNYEE